MNFRRIIFIVTYFCCLNFSLFGIESGDNRTDGYFIRGIVRDSITDEPIPNVFLKVSEGTTGTMTDDKGIFELTISKKDRQIIFHSQGYEDKILTLKPNRINLYAVYLSPTEEELEEVVIKKTKYSKKNNPAVELISFIRATAEKSDPEKRPYFAYKSYQRTVLGLNDLEAAGRNKNLFDKHPFLYEHIDTSEISGKIILPLSIREEVTEKSPTQKSSELIAVRNEGIDEILDPSSMRTFLNDIIGPIDVFSNDINLLQNRFVSPLSHIAPDFYKFYISDSVRISPEQINYTLDFYPHSRESFGFNGRLEVEKYSDRAFVKEITLRVPREINLNFIDNLYLKQRYVKAPNGDRLKVSDELVLELSVIPGTQGMYVKRVITDTDHSFEPPQTEENLSGDLSWTDLRTDSISNGESKVGKLMSRLRENKVFYWGEKVLSVLVNGYIPTNRDMNKSKFDFGPMNTTISGNPLEGVRLRAGGMTTAALSPHVFARGYTAYGFKDHRWKYGLELEYSFYKKERHSREFPVHSFRLNSSYDTYRPGQDYIFTNPDNVFLSLHRPGTDPIIYRRMNELTYTYESKSNFTVKASVANEKLSDSPLLNFTRGDDKNIHEIEKNWGEIQLRYAPGEKFYQTASNRFPINLDAPTFTLSHKISLSQPWTSGSVNITNIGFLKRFWFSAFGYLDVIAKGGHVWSKATPLFYLPMANTNMSYTIQPESFALTAPMEFVADSYGALFLSYWVNGNILNRIPLVKKMRLREVISLNGFYGHLSNRNNPLYQPEMIVWPGWETQAERLKKPYFEASVGIDNLFRCLRVDYVFRLNHDENMLSGASRHGFRIAFHVTF